MRGILYILTIKVVNNSQNQSVTLESRQYDTSGPSGVLL